MLENLNLREITPSNLLADTQIAAACDSITPELQSLTASIDEALIYSKIDSLPMEIVESLAWQFHISSKAEGWYFTRTEREKRNLVKRAIEIHRVKGTKAAILRVFDLLNLPSQIQEWFEYGGNPYHFKVSVDIQEEIPAEKIEAFGELISEYKNVRSHCEIDLNLRATATLYFGAISYTLEETTIYPLHDEPT